MPALKNDPTDGLPQWSFLMDSQPEMTKLDRWLNTMIPWTYTAGPVICTVYGVWATVTGDPTVWWIIAISLPAAVVMVTVSSLFTYEVWRPNEPQAITELQEGCQQ